MELEESKMTVSLLKRKDPSYSIVYNHCFGSTHKEFFAFTTIKNILIGVGLWIYSFLRFFITKDPAHVAMQGIWVLHIALLVKALIDYLKFGEYGNSFAQVMSLNLLITVVIAFLGWLNLVLLYIMFGESRVIEFSGYKEGWIKTILIVSGGIVTYKLYTAFLYYWVISKRIKYLEYNKEKSKIALRHLMRDKEEVLKVSAV